MGSHKSTRTPRGLLVHNGALFSPSTLSSSDSSYSESTPRPGIGVPTTTDTKIQAEVSANQQSKVTLRVNRAGNPGREGCGVAYVQGSEATSLARGWAPPNYLNGWAALEWSDTDAWEQFSCATIPGSQKVIAVYERTTGGSQVQARVYDPETWSWGSAATIVSAGGPAPAVAVVPNETGAWLVLALCGGGTTPTMYSSDDDGSSWSTYSEDPFPGITFGAGGTTRDRMRMAYHDGDVGLVARKSGANEITQYASDSLGSEFIQVYNAGSVGFDFDLFSVPGGRLAFTYIDNSTNRPNIRLLNSAFESIGNATATEVTTTTVTDMTAWADADGVIYVVGRPTSAADTLSMWRSKDGGATWEAFEFDLFDSSDTSTCPAMLAGTASMGQAVILHNWAANPGNEDGSLGSMICGGWSNVVPSKSSSGGSRQPPARVGFSNSLGRTWIPIELPQDMGWTLVGSSGTLTNGELDVNTTSANSHAELTSSGISMVVLTEFRVASGGVVASSGANVGVRLRMADGSNDFRLRLHADTAGWGAFDLYGSTQIGSTVSIDMTTKVQVLIVVTNMFLVTTYYRRAGATLWTAGPSGSLTDKGSGHAATNLLEWGHFGTPTAQSLWTQAHFVLAGFDTGNDDVIPKGLGALPYPLPEVGTSSQVAHLALRSGPGRRGDGIVINPHHEYRVERMFPTVEPSPAKTWRSTDTTEQTFGFDFSVDTWFGTAWTWALGFVGVNFKTAYLEGWNGSSWVTLVTYNGATGFEALSYDLTGNIIRPASGTADGGRYVQHREFDGATLIEDPAGTPAAFKCKECTGGLWQENSPVKPLAYLEIEDITGLGSSGTIDIVARSGIVVSDQKGTEPTEYYDKYRVRIPSQPTPEGYFEIGNMVLGPVFAFGQQWHNNSSNRIRRNVQDRVVEGVRRVREMHPLQRRWTAGWSEGLKLKALRAAGSALDPDYIGLTSGKPMVAEQDVWWQLFGVLKAAKSGEYPVVCLKSIPADGVTLTDPSLFLYGHLLNDPQFNVVFGGEGVDEYIRGETIAVEEQV